MAHYDYSWDYDSWHPSAYDTTPIAHDDEEMASLHHMWERWLDATYHLYPFDSFLNNELPNSSTSSCTSTSPIFGNHSARFTGLTRAAHSSSFASSPATDNMCMKSSTCSQASSSAIVADLPQLNLEDYNNTLETTTNLNYDVENTEIDVAVQAKCDIPSLHDGYAWRKYGQKNIKGRRFPRSYYRCAHPSCSIKKQIESSSKSEGYVATYIGKHNH